MIEQTVIAYCVEHMKGLEAIYLFGSQVNGLANSESDIDIAILCSEPFPAESRWKFSQTLANLLHQDVDILDLKQASTVMQCQVIQTGRRIFCKNPTRNAFFEMYTLSDYIQLNEQRSGILQDIRKRGSIYGG